jgi:S-adenosylmethionine:diacylglycerol 3-amino-3-carboxypropyl transferase
MKPPEPHDIVVCTDVLEHIEPDCLDDVLADIRRCTKKAALLVVATRPAMKTLSDGRNAHLIQEDFKWWEPHIEKAGFRVLQGHAVTGEFTLVCD